MKTSRAQWAHLLLAASLAGCAGAPTQEETPAPAPPQVSADQLRIEAVRWAMAVSAKIKSNWTRPAAAPAKFDCTVEIDLTPEGQVTSAKLRKSCGPDALNQSVIQAVWQSEPLPLPANPAVFESELILHFIP